MSTQGSITAAVLQAALVAAQRTLEATAADVGDELANHPVPGRANPVGSAYAHAVLAEDAVVNGILQGQPPLWATSWAGKTGTDKPMPMPGLVTGDIGEWYHTVKVDMAACRAYAHAVHAQTAAYLEGASDATLSREIDMSMIGMGMTPTSTVFSMLVTGHLNNLCGEISAAKGVLGRKGYPF